MVMVAGRNFGVIPLGSGKVPLELTVIGASASGPLARVNTVPNGWEDGLTMLCSDKTGGFCVTLCPNVEPKVPRLYDQP